MPSATRSFRPSYREYDPLHTSASDRYITHDVSWSWNFNNSPTRMFPDTFVNQTFLSRNSRSFARASTIHRFALSPAASGAGHRTREGVMDDFFCDMIRFAEGSERHDLAEGDTSHQGISKEWPDCARCLNYAFCVGWSYDAKSPPSMISSSGDSSCTPPSLFAVPSHPLSLPETYGGPKRPDIRRLKTWPRSGLPLSDCLPPLGDASTPPLSNPGSEAASTSKSGPASEQRIFPSQPARRESTTTAGIAEISAAADENGVKPAIKLDPGDVTRGSSEWFSREHEAFQQAGRTEPPPLSRSLSMPVVSPTTAADSYANAASNHRSSTSPTSGIPHLRPSKANQIRLWCEQSSAYPCDPNHHKDPPRTRSRNSRRPSENVTARSRQSETGALHAAELHNRLHGSGPPLDSVASSLGVFRCNQARALLILQKGDADFRAAHEYNLMLEYIHRRHAKWEVLTAPPSRRLKDQRASPGRPMRRLDNSHSPTNELQSSSHLTTALSDYPYPTPDQPSPHSALSTPITPKTPPESPSRLPQSRLKGMFGGIPISEESYRKSALYAKNALERRQEPRRAASAHQPL